MLRSLFHLFLLALATTVLFVPLSAERAANGTLLFVIAIYVAQDRYIRWAKGGSDDGR